MRFFQLMNLFEMVKNESFSTAVVDEVVWCLGTDAGLYSGRLLRASRIGTHAQRSRAGEGSGSK